MNGEMDRLFLVLILGNQLVWKVFDGKEAKHDFFLVGDAFFFRGVGGEQTVGKRSLRAVGNRHSEVHPPETEKRKQAWSRRCSFMILLTRIKMKRKKNERGREREE